MEIALDGDVLWDIGAIGVLRIKDFNIWSVKHLTVKEQESGDQVVIKLKFKNLSKLRYFPKP